MSDIIGRYIESGIKQDLKRKMVFLAGPRQVGKTTFAKDLLRTAGFTANKRYMNWDSTSYALISA